MSDTFCSDFVANLLPDLIVFVLGLLAAWWIGKRLNVWEWGQRRKDEELAQIDKALRYLDLLHDEIRTLHTNLSDLHAKVTQLPLQEVMPIDTGFWHLLERGGELPTLLNPELLSKLTNFYYHVDYTRHGLDMFVDYYDVTSSSLKTAMLRGMINYGLNKALEAGKDLPDCIDSEIQGLKNKLNRLE